MSPSGLLKKAYKEERDQDPKSKQSKQPVDSIVYFKPRSTLEVATELNEILNSPNGGKYYRKLVTETECKLKFPKHRSKRSHMNTKTKKHVNDHLSEIDSVKSEVESEDEKKFGVTIADLQKQLDEKAK